MRNIRDRRWLAIIRAGGSQRATRCAALALAPGTIAPTARRGEGTAPLATLGPSHCRPISGRSPALVRPAPAEVSARRAAGKRRRAASSCAGFTTRRDGRTVRVTTVFLPEPRRMKFHAKRARGAFYSELVLFAGKYESPPPPPGIRLTLPRSLSSIPRTF